MTTDSNNNDTPKLKSKLPIILGGAIVLLFIIAGVGFFAYTKIIKPKIDEARTAIIDASANVTENIAEGTISTQVYPGAVQIDPPADVSPTDTRVFFQTPDSADDVIAWYVTTYATNGFVPTDSYVEGDARVTHFENTGKSIDLFTWNIGDGLTGFSLVAAQLPTENFPGGEGGEVVATVMPAPVVEDTPIPSADATPPPAAPAETPTPRIPPVAPSVTFSPISTPDLSVSPIQLDINTSVPSLRAGTLTRYTYELTLVSELDKAVTVTVEAMLPAGITLLPDESPGIQYFPTDGKVSYEATLSPAEPTYSIHLVVVTDLFIEPGELLIKGYLHIPDKDPILEVNKLLVTK